MDLKDELTDRLGKALSDYLTSQGAEASAVAVTVEAPRDPDHGDFATNLAMQLAKALKRNPMKVAEELLKHFDGAGLVREATVAKPGFINFRMESGATTNILRRIADDGDAFGRTRAGRGARVLVEFVSANPTGPLHIGHARNAVVGDVLARLLEATGHVVSREYYFNNAGVQMKMLGNTLRLRVAEKLGRPVEWPEQYYRGDYMTDIAKTMVEEIGREELAARLDSLDTEPSGSQAAAGPGAADAPKADAPKKDAAPQGEAETTDLESAEAAGADRNPYRYFTDFAVREILKTIDADLKAMGIPFDNWFLESSLYEDGSVEKTLAEMRKRGVIYDADGAVWFRSTDFGVDRDRVVVKSDGSYTYLMPDIAYNENKYSRGYDRLVTLLGADHHGQISSLVAAAEALGHPRGALDYVLYHMVTMLKDGVLVKLSTRGGEFITLKEMTDELGVGVVRYFFAMRDPDAQMVFDWALAKSTSMDNPVYYIQYAHARCCSLFRKAEETGHPFRGLADTDLMLLVQPEEQALIRSLARLPKVIESAAKNLAPHFVTNYLQEVATIFHTYFTRGTNDASVRFIVPEQPALTQARLALIHCLRLVLANALRVLGIEPMERM